MALYLITGVMGGGKSYYGAEICRKAFEEGAIVHTNISLNEEEIKEQGWSEQFVKLPEDPADWKTVLHAGEEGKENLLMVDEAALTFHVHDQQKKRSDNRDIFELLVWSRKLGLDVHFISQSAANIDSMLRRLTQVRIHCVALKMIPFVGWFARYLLGDFKRMRYAGGEGKNLIGSTYHRFSMKVGNFYRTDDTVGRSMGLKKSATRTDKKDKDKRLSLIVAVFLVLSVGVGIWRVKALFADAKDGPPGTAHPASVAPGSVAHVPAGPPVAKRLYSVENMAWEVEAQDDLVISAVDKAKQKIFCRDGHVLALGQEYNGENITGLLEVNGRYYATTKAGRKIIARQWTKEERKLWMQSSQTSPATSSGSSALPSSWGQGLSTFLGR